jgi:hypothetical protein
MYEHWPTQTWKVVGGGGLTIAIRLSYERLNLLIPNHAKSTNQQLVMPKYPNIHITSNCTGAQYKLLTECPISNKSIPPFARCNMLGHDNYICYPFTLKVRTIVSSRTLFQEQINTGR